VGRAQEEGCARSFRRSRRPARRGWRVAPPPGGAAGHAALPLAVVGADYNLTTGVVDFFDVPGGWMGRALEDPVTARVHLGWA
jgi:hypothetical protein